MKVVCWRCVITRWLEWSVCVGVRKFAGEREETGKKREKSVGFSFPRSHLRLVRPLLISIIFRRRLAGQGRYFSSSFFVYNNKLFFSIHHQKASTPPHSLMYDLLAIIFAIYNNFVYLLAKMRSHPLP